MRRGRLGGLIIVLLLVIVVGIVLLAVRPWQGEVVRIAPSVDLYSDRYVILTNYEDVAYTDYPVYLPLAFPDNIVTQSNFDGMHIRDEAGTEFPYQVEDATYYTSGYLKWAGIWFLASMEPNQSEQLTLTFEDTVPDYGVFGDITVDDDSVSITTDSFQLVQLMTDHGLAWYHIIDADGTEMLTNPGVASSENSIFELRDQEYDKSYKTMPHYQVRYNQDITNQCSVTYTSGPLFVKVAWSVVDDFDKEHSGWFRVWKSQPWIEFLTDSNVPVNEEFTQGYFSYTMDSGSVMGNPYNSGLVNYVSNNTESLALSCVIYTVPTNNYGALASGYGTDYRADSISPSRLYIYYIDRSAYGEPVNGLLTVPLSVILKGQEATVDNAVNRYFDRPIASYYCLDEDKLAKYEIVELTETYLENNAAYFIDAQEANWNGQLAKTYATLILMDINPSKYVSKFISTLQSYALSDSSLLAKATEWPQTVPNLVESGYWVYKKTGDEAILTELHRLMNFVGLYDSVVQDINDIDLPINKRKAFLEMMCQLIELFPDDEYAIALYDEVTQPDFLYNSDEAFNAYYYPKYKIYGQAYSVPRDGKRSMDTVVTTAYLLNMTDIIKAGYPLDMDSWARSYVALQNSLWARTRGEYKDDTMFGWEHNPQDRLGHTSTYVNYIRIYLYLPYLYQNNGSPLIAGTTTARLSLEYIKSVQRIDGTIPHATDYWIAFQIYTYPDGAKLYNNSIPAGWYTDVGLFEIALSYYCDSQPDFIITETPTLTPTS